LRRGRVPLAEVRDGTEVSEDSSASSVVDGEGQAEGGSVLCSVWRSRPPRFASGGVVSIPSLAGSKTRGFFEGVDGAARPSQRFDRFEGGVAVGVGAATAGAGLGRYARSRTRRARWFVSAVRPATFAETLRKAPDDGVLTFFQRLVFSKKQTTENWTGAAFEVS
jgi:hypothetical protein